MRERRWSSLAKDGAAARPAVSREGLDSGRGLRLPAAPALCPLPNRHTGWIQDEKRAIYCSRAVADSACNVSKQFIGNNLTVFQKKNVRVLNLI